MGQQKHQLKPYGSGFGKVLTRKHTLLKENVIVRDAKSSGPNQYNKNGK